MVFRNKKGMTLVEMLVAIVIFSLVMTGFSLLSLKAWQSNRSALEQAMATSTGSRALAKVIRDLREVKQGQDGAYPIKTVGVYDLTVFLDDDGDGDAERVHYFVEGEVLKKGVTDFIGGSYAEEDEVVTVLLNYVTNRTLEKPLFFYYGNNYPEDSVGNPLVSPLAQDIKLIKVHLWVNIRPIVAPENINFESFVELRNLNEY